MRKKEKEYNNEIRNVSSQAHCALCGGSQATSGFRGRHVCDDCLKLIKEIH